MKILYFEFLNWLITVKEREESEALKRVKLIQSLAVRVEESNENLNVRAGILKAKNRISVADAYIAALSQTYNGILIHKDPEFEKISPPVKEFKLPYKTH